MTERRAPSSNLAVLALLGGAAALYYATRGPSVNDRLAFVRKFGPIDLEISKREGWLPGVLTGWAAMESAWGTSELARYGRNDNPQGGFNVFGVKAGPKWQSLGRPYIVKVTHEFQDTPKAVTIHLAFRAYDSWKQSAEDLVNLLKIESVYKGALEALKRGDIGGFLANIEASGYSTAANYGDRIMGAIKTVAATA